MAKKVKIYEIAKLMGISSAELVEVCQRAGYTHIKHHSNAVPPEEADEIRKTAIKLYRPKRVPAPAPPQPKPKKEPRPRKPQQRQSAGTRPVLTSDVKPVTPPKPMGMRAQAEELSEEQPPATPPPLKRRRRPEATADEHVTKRTIIFKQRRKPIPKKEREQKIELTRPVSVRVLSERLGVPANELIKKLMFDHGVRANINQTLDDEVVQLLGLEYEVEITLKEAKSAEHLLLEQMPEDRPEDLVPRPPVIALLGHVDHGKTSILDRIRNTRVAESEAGGITQDIGAWQVAINGRTLTFIDTPGHEAFTAMRARGARITDIVVLVVAADDGVMPQTVEAIDHARAAEVPMVVAINKVDKPDANPMRTKQQLAGLGLNPEEWGGEVGCVELSALTGQGIDELLERIALEAELLETRANPNRPATGAVIEARMQPGRGVVTNVIVRNGTLRVGDILVCGNAYGTVRALFNDRGARIDHALPSQPVSISGLNRVPEAGDTFIVVNSLETARRVAKERQTELEAQRLKPRRHVTLENLYESLQKGQTRRLNIILKADVQGSLEPLTDSLAQLGNEEVSVRIIRSAVGDVTTGDVLLADASDGVIVAFRVGLAERVEEMASARGVEIVRYDVIYEVTEQVRAALEGLLEPEQREQRVGLAEVRQTFYISRYGTIAGCLVAEGRIRRNCRVRVLRGDQVIHTGAIASLRQGKNDVREVEAGRECGINIEGFNDVQVGDMIECFEVTNVRRKLISRPRGEAVGSQSAAGPSEQA